MRFVKSGQSFENLYLFIIIFLFEHDLGQFTALDYFFINRFELFHVKIAYDVENKDACFVKMVNIFTTIFFIVSQVKKQLLSVIFVLSYEVEHLGLGKYYILG
jgi:hypothetical protein